MYQQIAQSLFQQNSCTLPGIGTLSIINESAQTDFINSRILSPVQKIIFESIVTDSEMHNQFSSISESIKSDLVKGEKVEVAGVGNFFIDEKNKIVFTPVKIDENFFQPVTAERVIRENVTHNMLVGDKETTSTVMTDFFTEKPAITDRWWIWAAAIFVISVSFLSFHFYKNGMTFSSQNKIELAPSDTFHKDVK